MDKPFFPFMSKDEMAREMGKPKVYRVTIEDLDATRCGVDKSIYRDCTAQMFSEYNHEELKAFIWGMFEQLKDEEAKF